MDDGDAGYRFEPSYHLTHIADRTKPSRDRLGALRERLLNLGGGTDADVRLAYMRRFQDQVQDDILVVGNLPVEEAQRQERMLVDSREQAERDHKASILERDNILRQRETDVKLRLIEEYEERAKENQKFAQRERLLEKDRFRRLRRAFNRAEDHMKHALKARKADVTAAYGQLDVQGGLIGNVQGRRFRIDWDSAPQPMQIHIDALRGVKDKAPSGKFVVVVSQYNTLGGSPMRWSNLRGHEWAGATHPVKHGGHFGDVEMRFDQSVYSVLPAYQDLRPGMVYVFEVFQLKGENTPLDRVVAWGIFPMVNNSMHAAAGLFKVPLLFGPVDHSITTYSQFHERYEQDLDNWFCNMYIKLKALPRYVGGQREHEIELEYTSRKLGFPDRGVGSGHVEEGESRNLPEIRPHNSKADTRDVVGTDVSAEDGYATIATSRYVRSHGLKPQDYSAVADYDQSEVGGNVEDPEDGAAVSRYGYSVLQRTLDDGVRKSIEKREYIVRQLKSELGIENWRSTEFYLVIAMFVVLFYFRLLIHYLGQWLILYANEVPSVTLDIRWYIVEVGYQSSSIGPLLETFLVFFGPLSNVIVAIWIIFAVLLFSFVTGSKLGGAFSRFLQVYLLLTLLDPILILIVDLITFAL